MSNQKLFLGLGVILAIILFAIVFFDKQIFMNTLNKYSLLPKPEPFTELYFEDHLKLPKVYGKNNDNSFRFTVHNLEYKTYTYDYYIKAVATDSARTISKGSITLKHDEYKTIKEKISSEEAKLQEEETQRNQKQETKRQRQREFAGALSMILVGTPLYLYHWKTIKKEAGQST